MTVSPFRSEDVSRTICLVFLSLAFIGSAAFSGCAMPAPTVVISVALPAIPDPWADAWGTPGFVVHWQTNYLLEGGMEVPPGIATVALELPTGAVTALLCYPVWKTGGPALAVDEELRPAGAIWAGDDPGDVASMAAGKPVRLTFEGGLSAFVLHDAARRGANIQEFNYRRLVSEIADRAPADPWQIDSARLVRAVCERAMRVDCIRELPVVAIPVVVPDGRWYGRSWSAPALDGGLHTIAVPSGLTAWYDDRARRFVVFVDEDERVWFAISPPD